MQHSLANGRKGKKEKECMMAVGMALTLMDETEQDPVHQDYSHLKNGRKQSFHPIYHNRVPMMMCAAADSGGSRMSPEEILSRDHWDTILNMREPLVD